MSEKVMLINDWEESSKQRWGEPGEALEQIQGSPISDIAVKHGPMFRLLAKWILKEDPPSAYAWRLAPSIISRCDAELFGVSAPRFAVRAYLPQELGFINLRRSHFLRVKVQGYSPQTDEGPWLLDDNKEETIKYDRRSFCLPFIGDCILSLPERFRDDFRVIEDDFTVVMGEKNNKSIIGTPYVQYCADTGSCLPAVAFVASMILNKHISTIHSLPEIALLLHQKQDSENPEKISYKYPDNVVIEHTTALKIVHYFTEHANLNAGLQTIVYSSKILSEYQKILRAYIGSKMPVVIPVNLQVLFNEEGIYRSNKINAKALNLAEADMDSPHAIIAVGYGKKSSNKNEFIVHEPKCLPFLKASVQQLFDARDKTLTGAGEVYCIPVTPPKVKVPLFTTYSLKGGHPIGMRQIFKCLAENSRSVLQLPDLISDDDIESGGEWRLTQAETIKDQLIELLDENEVRNVKDGQLDLMQKSLLDYLSDDHWVWLQQFSSCILVWDAEKEPPTNYQKPQSEVKFLSYHVMSFVINNDGTINKCSKVKPIKRISLISSSSISPSYPSGGYFECHSQLKNLGSDYDDIGVELYAFMDSDMQKLSDYLKTLGNNIIKTPVQKLVDLENNLAKTSVEFMSLLFDDDSAIEKIALKIKAETENRPICSMATFIPEIMSNDQKRRGKGIEAIEFACKLLSELQLDSKQPRCLEIVGGGISHGIWPGVDSQGNKVLVSSRIKNEDKILYMKQCLGHERIKTIIKEKNICLVVELEPGQMFAFHDEKGAMDLIRIFRDLEREDFGLKGHFGLNLDIAHWMLMTPNKKFPKFINNISDYIRHAHITDGAFHLADLPLGAKTNTKEILPWVDFLKKRYNDTNGPNGTFDIMKLCSEILSVEVECSPNDKFLKEALDAARRYFA